MIYLNKLVYNIIRKMFNIRHENYKTIILWLKYEQFMRILVLNFQLLATQN